MLSENETLFVEPKAGLNGGGQGAVLVCDTLGGWVLVGVTNGVTNEGEPDGWRPVRAAEMTDRVRECLKAQAARGSPPRPRDANWGVPTDVPGVLLGDLQHLQ
jgi:hypothetical protein